MLKCVDIIIKPLVEIADKCYETMDKLGTFVRELLLDYSKAFDLINREMFTTKLVKMKLPPHLVRWMAAWSRLVTFQSESGYPDGTLSGPKDFFCA